MGKITELIKVVEKDGIKVVSAKGLYLGLGLSKDQWSRWYKKNILLNEFFKENIDFIGVRHYVEGNETQDFSVTLEFAKHISMMARTEKSHEYRNYFIACENQLAEITEVIRENGQANQEDLNKIRFSERRIKNNFANCPYKDIETLVEEFKDYAFDLDAKTRIARCRSVIKGLRELHDKLALLTTNNIGNCYNIINIIADVNELEHKTENNRNGGIRAGLRRKLNKCS